MEHLVELCPKHIKSVLKPLIKENLLEQTCEGARWKAIPHSDDAP